MLLTLFPKIKLPGLVRVSFGIENTEEDVDKLILALKKTLKIPQKASDSSVNVATVLPMSKVKKQIGDILSDSLLKVYG